MDISKAPLGKAVPIDEVSRLIGLIYESALDPQTWEATLEALRAASGCANAVFNITDIASGSVTQNVAVGIESRWLERMSGYGADVVEVWGGREKIGTYSPHEPQVLSRAVPSEAYVNNRYYREWARPQGLDDVIALLLSRDPTFVASIGMGRHKSAGPVTDQQIALLRLLIPHLQRAASISNVLKAQSVKLSALETTLDLLDSPALVVNARLEVRHANRAARHVIERTGGHIDRTGVMRLSDNAATERLRALLASAEQDAIGGLGQRNGVPMRTPAGDAHIIHILPLNMTARGGTESGLAALFIAPTLSQRSIPIAAVAALYELTSAEAKVMEMIGSGLAPAAVAQRLGVAPSTVKTHLTQVFAKTGCRRQAELIRLVSRLTPPA